MERYNSLLPEVTRFLDFQPSVDGKGKVIWSVKVVVGDPGRVDLPPATGLQCHLLPTRELRHDVLLVQDNGRVLRREIICRGVFYLLLDAVQKLSFP